MGLVLISHADSSWTRTLNLKEGRMNKEASSKDSAVEDPVEAAIREMLLKVSVPLSPEDKILVERLKGVMRRQFAHGFHQLIALGIDTRGNEFDGLQLDCPIGQSSNCAEVGVVMKAAQAKARLTTIVTVHHKREEDGGEVHVVAPCAACVERLLHFFPRIQVIVWYEGELRKVPVRSLLPIPYKRRMRGDGNGDSTQQFPK